MENEERELQRENIHTWTPGQRQYVSYFPHTYTYQWVCVYRDISPTTQIRVEVRVKAGHLVWAKYRGASEAIDVDGVFMDYWSSTNRDFTVQSQSLLSTSPRITSDRERQSLLSLEDILAL